MASNSLPDGAGSAANPARVFLSGPMSGYQNFNRAAFNAEADRLRALGYDVISPAELIVDPAAELVAMSPGEAREHWRKCMRTCLAKLLTCQSIHMLPNWERSEGARAEHFVATTIGLAVSMAQEVAA